LQHHPMLQRKLQHLASAVAISAIAAAVLSLTGAKPGWAEYQIQEADIEGGSVEIEYRGAYHWGIPKAAEGDGAEDEAAFEPAEVNDTRQSHELELQMGIND